VETNYKYMRTKPFNLKSEDRKLLQFQIKSGVRNSREFERAYILLALDKGKTHQEIEDFYNVSRITIWRIKQKYLSTGLQTALKDESRPGKPAKYTDKERAVVVATACTDAPAGRARWTLRLLERELQKHDGMDTINRETIRLILKKTNVNLG